MLPGSNEHADDGAAGATTASSPLSLQILGIYGQYDDHPDLLKDAKEQSGMYRYRLNTTNAKGEDYERAIFSVDGLMYKEEEKEDEMMPHEFYHVNELKGKERSGEYIITATVWTTASTVGVFI